MQIEINAHSSIKVTDEKVIYFDPFQIKEGKNDADIIFITHSHFDHYSKEDIEKVKKEDTVFVIPDSIEIEFDNVIKFKPEEEKEVLGYKVEAVRAYNPNKQFHVKENNWLGYVVTIDNQRVYVAGDTDINEDVLKVKCDIALVPCGGKYTMDYKEAAELINSIKPKLAIPTHYGQVAGGADDGFKFKELVDKNIEVEIKIQ